MKNNAKEKLKRRGYDLYKKYFFNPNEIINIIIEQYDRGDRIDETICEVIFDNNVLSSEETQDFIIYYPDKLKELKIITNEVANILLKTYNTTIKCMKSRNKGKSTSTRAILISSAKKRANELNLPFNIRYDDILLPEICPILDKKINYNSNISTNYSPSLDRIDPKLGYIKGNIQVISKLANSMKSNANREELKAFSKNILTLLEYWDLE